MLTAIGGLGGGVQFEFIAHFAITQADYSKIHPHTSPLFQSACVSTEMGGQVNGAMERKVARASVRGGGTAAPKTHLLPPS